MKTIISVLGADIYKDSFGAWHTNDLKIRDKENQEPIESFRVAGAFYSVKKEALIYAQGGLADDTHPPIADVMEHELLQMGMPQAQVSREIKSKTSYHQLIQLQDFLRRKMPKIIMIVTNDWHLPRIRAFIEYLPEFSTLQYMKPVFVAAEEVLLTVDREKWQSSIAKARSRPEMKEVIGLEKKGVQQIMNGTYEKE